MEHSQRMVLVPEGKAFRLDSHPTVQTPGDPVSRLDSELSAILYSKKFSNDSEKWLAYQQILEKYLEKKGVFKLPEVTQPSSNDDVKEKKNTLDTSVMLHGVAQSYRSKAKQLAEFIDRSSNIRWTEKGRLVIDNVELPHSNIVDLLNDAVRERKTHAPPNGRAQLSAALRKAGVPRKFIGNAAFWTEGEPSPNSSSDNFTETSTPKESPNKVQPAVNSWLKWRA